MEIVGVEGFKTILKISPREKSEYDQAISLKDFASKKNDSQAHHLANKRLVAITRDFLEVHSIKIPEGHYGRVDNDSVTVSSERLDLSPIRKVGYPILRGVPAFTFNFEPKAGISLESYVDLEGNVFSRDILRDIIAVKYRKEIRDGMTKPDAKVEMREDAPILQVVSVAHFNPVINDLRDTLTKVGVQKLESMMWTYKATKEMDSDRSNEFYRSLMSRTYGFLLETLFP